MLHLQEVTYSHPNKDLLFSDLSLSVNAQDKIALIGNNGAGKSTLLRIMSGQLQPLKGTAQAGTKPFYVPQLFEEYDHCTIAQALQIGEKIKALEDILKGSLSDENFKLLDDDWTIEERCKTAFAHWNIAHLGLSRQMNSLSGGEKTKVFLSGIDIHQPEIILLDEPGNHLDHQGRTLLYNYIKSTSNTLVMVSHDAALLNLAETVYELSRKSITVYGGNYDFYVQQKQIEKEALALNVKSMEKALRKAKQTEKESAERQQRLNARGKGKQEKAGLPTISMNTFRNNAEKSTSRMKAVHAEKVNGISQHLQELRSALPDTDQMKLRLDHSDLHNGKALIAARDINFQHDDKPLWKQGLTFEISSGQRVVVNGQNGSGKTTLLKILLGKLQASSGSIDRTTVNCIYIDQHYSLIDNSLSVYEQAELFNSGNLQQHEVKIRLTRFLFSKESWNRPCGALSGGERMRLLICCLTIGQRAPDMIVLDEPTNNLDIQNVAILIAAINEYRGTLLVVCHDEDFLRQIRMADASLISL